MPKPSWRLALLLALAALVPGTGQAGKGPKGPAPLFTSISFSQITWLESPGAPLQTNSAWGVLSFAYKPAPKTWFLNANVKLPGGRNEHWFLRNLPLSGEKNPTRTRREAVFLDLRRLGLGDGMDWTSVQAAFSMHTAPLNKAPSMTTSSVLPVGERNVLLDNTLLSSTVEPFDPGVPRPILITRIPRYEFNLRVSRPVQEERGHGVAGAFARSLDWLNQIHKWDPGLDAQDIYEELKLLGVSTHGDDNGNGSKFDEWIQAKDAYSILLSEGEIETTLWDGADIFPPIDGVKEEDQQDFMTWYKKTPDDADIELVVRAGNNTVVMMLTECFIEGGRTYVRFRGDDKPDDPSSGDEEDKVAEIFKGADGSWYFLSNKWKIVGAFAEAVKR